MPFKGAFPRGDGGARERLALPVKRKRWMRSATGHGGVGGGGSGVWSLWLVSPPLSNPRSGVAHPGWRSGDAALGTESPGHPGSVR